MSHEASGILEEFAAVIRDLTDTAKHISHIEEAKAEAASVNRHDQMDGFIQDEQAYILKLRGQEQHRIRLSEELGWKSLTFRQILETASPEQAELLTPLFLALEDQLKQLEQSRGAAEKIINARLRELQIAIARQQGGSYDDAGNISLDSPVQTRVHNKYV